MSDRQPAGDFGTLHRTDAGEGYYVVRLVTRQALDREGLCMDHCVGNGSYDGLAGDEVITSDGVWSLRRPDGVSVVTALVMQRRLISAKGARNGPLSNQSAARLSVLAGVFDACGSRLDVDLASGVLVGPDGTWWSQHNAPEVARDALVARLEAEQAERVRRLTERAEAARAMVEHVDGAGDLGTRIVRRCATLRNPVTGVEVLPHDRGVRVVLRDGQDFTLLAEEVGWRDFLEGDDWPGATVHAVFQRVVQYQPRSEPAPVPEEIPGARVFVHDEVDDDGGWFGRVYRNDAVARHLQEARVRLEGARAVRAGMQACREGLTSQQPEGATVSREGTLALVARGASEFAEALDGALRQTADEFRLWVDNAFMAAVRAEVRESLPRHMVALNAAVTPADPAAARREEHARAGVPRRLRGAPDYRILEHRNRGRRRPA